MHFHGRFFGYTPGIRLTGTSIEAGILSKWRVHFRTVWTRLKFKNWRVHFGIYYVYSSNKIWIGFRSFATFFIFVRPLVALCSRFVILTHVASSTPLCSWPHALIEHTHNTTRAHAHYDVTSHVLVLNSRSSIIHRHARGNSSLHDFSFSLKISSELLRRGLEIDILKSRH